ncbi:MAG: twin-arginine translocase subunit TatC [Actinomyces sp.]|uniref:twin-arginine translocase subunit TatC n=1 Tax=Actinomyces sp. TaxID=29317 RepID=UPI0026DCEAFF|nr:twin-arginine translocase subunit TatC [Actinomyces sp.]MDO4243308.1 twin-arginine translocase subunit TatC [Actinomyces sp.]
MVALPKVFHTRRQDNPEAVMSIGDHLRELRDRLVISAAGVLVMSVVGYLFYDQAFSLITHPIEDANANGADISINFDTVLSSFDMKLKVSIWLGVFLASPLWMYQFWAYVGPGMTRKEKLYTWAYGATGLVLFAAGAALGVFILPHAVTILTGFIPESGTGYLQASLYLSFVMRLILVFGVAFLLPELLVALNQLGVMKGRTMLAGWRWAVVAIFTFMAFANPLPDPWSMIFMAVPITGLYFLACYIAITHDKRVARREAEENAALDAALAGTGTAGEIASGSESS